MRFDHHRQHDRFTSGPGDGAGSFFGCQGLEFLGFRLFLGGLVSGFRVFRVGVLAFQALYFFRFRVLGLWWFLVLGVAGLLGFQG